MNIEFAVREIFDGRTGTFGQSWERSYTRIFIVTTNDELAEASAVAFAPFLPRIGDVYRNNRGDILDAGAFCTSVSPSQANGDPTCWEVTCEYANISAPLFDSSTAEGEIGGGGPGPGGDAGQPSAQSGSGGGGGNNPDEKPWKITWSQDTYTRFTRKAYAVTEVGQPEGTLAPAEELGDGSLPYPGIPIANSAGQQVAPLEESQRYPVVTVQRIVKDYNPKLAADYAMCLNKSEFIGWGPRRVQLLEWTAEEMWQGDRRFWNETLKLRFCPAFLETWQPEFLDAGYNQFEKDRPPRYIPGLGLPPSDEALPEKLFPIRDSEGNRVSEPWPLNGSGRALSPQEVAGDKAVYLRAHIYPVRDFEKLNLVKKKKKPPEPPEPPPEPE